MAKVLRPNATFHYLQRARRCRIEAARAIHPSIKSFLLELAAEFEAASGETLKLDPDDPELQDAVADRLALLAARRLAQ